MMKKLIAFVIAALLLWNIVLTYQINRLQNVALNDNPQTLIRQSTTELESAVTDVVEKTSTKVVGVTSRSGYSILSGSGIIYGANDEEVIVVTNNHLLINSGTIYVNFANDIEIEAELVGKDLVSDLAVLRVRPQFSVEPFVLGDSSLTNSGEWVLLISNMAGEQNSGNNLLTIISNNNKLIDKDLNGDGFIDWQLPLLQVATPIYSSSTGGAVVNMAGELIGIVNNRLSSSTLDGLGYAVTINEIKVIADSILEIGKVSRTTLGASLTSLQDLPVYLKSHYQIKLNLEGMFIKEVFENGPFFQAELKAGDIITLIDDEKMENDQDVRSFLSDKKPEDIVEVTYIRDDETLKVNVVLQ